MFVPKPSTYLQFENISVIVMSRVGGAVSASRTFDITVNLKGGVEHQFSNINREEQGPLESFFQAKNLKIRNEMLEDVSLPDQAGLFQTHLTVSPAHTDTNQQSTLIQAALRDANIDSEEEDVVAAGADRGSAEEDSEEDDEDFQSDSDSDVAEEYDSAHESSGSGSDADMADGGGDGDDARAEEPKKKKTKTSK